MTMDWRKYGSVLEISRQKDGGAHPKYADKNPPAGHGSPAVSAERIKVRCTVRVSVDRCDRISGGRFVLRRLARFCGRQFRGNILGLFVEAPE